MIEDPLKILQEIIDRHGDCEGLAGPAVCKRCPLGNKKKPDGNKMNCMDYLGVGWEMDEDERSEIYERAAADELLNIEFDRILSEDNDTDGST